MASRRLTEVARAGMHRAAERRVHSGDISTEDDVRKRSKKAYRRLRVDGMHGFRIADLGLDMRTGAERQDVTAADYNRGLVAAARQQVSQVSQSGFRQQAELGRRRW